ncbi:hypothetical protein TNCV_2303431 [Trichonephila clavipes]|nr:hypothetical protein TNCV_2303431 [Trichonephila clavipes]
MGDVDHHDWLAGLYSIEILWNEVALATFYTFTGYGYGERLDNSLSQNSQQRWVIEKPLLLLTSTVTSYQDPRNSSWQGASCTPDISRSFEHHTGNSTIFLGSTPIFEGERSGGGQSPPTSLPLPTTSRENMRLDGYLEYPHAAKAHGRGSRMLLVSDSGWLCHELEPTTTKDPPYREVMHTKSVES